MLFFLSSSSPRLAIAPCIAQSTLLPVGRGGNPDAKVASITLDTRLRGYDSGTF